MEYNCVKCSFKSEMRDDLKKHINSKHRVMSVYICTKCDFETEEKHLVEEHENKEHGNAKKDSEMGRRLPDRKKPVIVSHAERKKNGYCAFWNNGYCRYEDLCYKLHEEIPACHYGSNCSRQNCQYFHDQNPRNHFLGSRNQLRFREEDFPPLWTYQGRRKH